MAATDEAEHHAFSQGASFGNFMPLALKNALFTVLTLTLYRFWARSDVRRRLWATTRIMGDPLEYSGVGAELFRGFLISIPVFFAPAIFIYYVAPFLMDPGAAYLLGLGFYLLAVPLIATAFYLMRRYQLSRTRWRGIRMSLAGGAFEYAIASSGWSMLEAITLGWYHPAARMRRARLIWENTRLGDEPFQFAEGETDLVGNLYPTFALAWFGAPIGLLAASAVNFLGVRAIVTYNLYFLPPWSIFVLAGFALLFGLAVFALCASWFNAAAMNRIAGLLTLDGARFRLNAKPMGLYGVTLAGAAIFILSLGLLAPVAGMLQVRYILNRLEMIGAPRFADIGQTRAIAPSQGEGLADAFDLDFGVGVI
ncbi:MAG: DUF898 family protein [Alphaproteobacteria bacterium]|nr:DUF898 family protein [Alphaproteobacteria bacterium]